MPDRSAASYASWTPDNRLWASVVRLKAGRLAWARTGTDGCRGGASEEDVPHKMIVSMQVEEYL